MAKGRRLKAALNAHKGVDHKVERQKQLQKQATKRKQLKNANKNEEELIDGHEEDEDMEIGGVALATEDESEEEVPVDISRIDETSSSEEDDVEEDQEDAEDDKDNEDEKEAASDIEGPNGVPLPSNIQGNGKIIEEDADDIPFSDIASLDSEERGDIVPFQRLTINNHAALTASLTRITLPSSTLPFSTLQTITLSTPTTIKDVDDDLNRELQFYAQSLAAVKEAKKQLKAEGVPFSRPSDFFAEMVKSEEHMGRVRQRLVDDAAGKKAATDARRQRDLKKFGKAVQVAKQQERDKAKRETLDKINVLKRKRSNALPATEKEQDMFDIALDSETKRQRTGSGNKASGKDGKNFKRQSKNEKYGFGGKKRHSKSGDALSSAGIGLKGKLGTKKRLGKSRRANSRA